MLSTGSIIWAWGTRAGKVGGMGFMGEAGYTIHTNAGQILRRVGETVCYATLYSHLPNNTACGVAGGIPCTMSTFTFIG